MEATCRKLYLTYRSTCILSTNGFTRILVNPCWVVTMLTMPHAFIWQWHLLGQASTNWMLQKSYRPTTCIIRPITLAKIKNIKTPVFFDVPFTLPEKPTTFRGGWQEKRMHKKTWISFSFLVSGAQVRLHTASDLSVLGRSHSTWLKLNKTGERGASVNFKYWQKNSEKPAEFQKKNISEMGFSIRVFFCRV